MTIHSDLLQLKQLISMEILIYFIFKTIKCDRSTWPARRKVDRSTPKSVRTLSVDRPLFRALPWWMWLKKKSQTWLAAMDYLDRKSCFRNFLHSKMANFVFSLKLSAQPPFQTSKPISSGLCFLVCNNQNQQTEMLKKGVNSTTETRKWASATLVWSLNPWISCAWSILSKGPPLPLPPSPIFMASLPRYQKTYLLCTISLEYSATVKKTQNFPVF